MGGGAPQPAGQGPGEGVGHEIKIENSRKCLADDRRVVALMTASAESLESLLGAVEALQRGCTETEKAFEVELRRVHPVHGAGARNLLHYLAVRQHDLRDLQQELAELGLSSLGRMERCVLYTLQRVEHALRCLSGDCVQRPVRESPTDFRSGESRLSSNTAALLGPPPQRRSSRIMVTLPPDVDVDFLKGLLAEGMNIARVNGAKGDEESWRSVIGNVRSASEATGLDCRVLFDLAGPNPRTVELPERLRGPKRVRVGETLLLCESEAAAARAHKAHRPRAALGCTMPELLPHLKAGDQVHYDDGKFSGVVRGVDDGVSVVEVTACRKPAVRLRGDKGLIFPQASLPYPSLTPRDVQALEFAARHADIVGLSFVRGPAEVTAVQRELESRGAVDKGLLLKIETVLGFRDLGRVLLEGMRSEKVGVMVARGDMALELGYGRLAEAQEEILWLCEAALVPVVWATQVLESLSKTGVPSRAEVTDAAMGGRAECVMLNRGDHSREAVAFLRDVLERMQEHQQKKRSLLRRLRISDLAPF